MAENKKTEALDSLLQRVHLGVTILVALGGLWLGIQQQVLKADLGLKQDGRAELKEYTTHFMSLLTSVKTIMAELDIKPEKRRVILLSLLRLEKELRKNEEGELTRDQVADRVDKLTLHLALLSGATEALAHISRGKADLIDWVDIAKNSGDMDVRRSAIAALHNVGRLTSDDSTRKQCVDWIVELSMEWNVPEIRGEARNALESLAAVEGSRSGGEASDVSHSIEDALVLLLGAVGEPSQIVAAEDSDGGIADKGSPAPASRQDIAAIQNALQQVGGGSEQRLEGEALKNKLDPLLQQLGSDDTATRRRARTHLAELGESAIPELTKVLARGDPTYRTKIGIVTALRLMGNDVSISGVDPAPLVALLGDPDRTLRENTFVFLRDLIDSESIEILIGALADTSKLQDRMQQGNLIYNSVSVLGEWALPASTVDKDLKSKIDQTLSEIRKRLEEDEGAWKTTKSKLREYQDKIGS
jgi:ElaB/YqjD/DUF883 family membrane-anchored ribosome-binding protein